MSVTLLFYVYINLVFFSNKKENSEYKKSAYNNGYRSYMLNLKAREIQGNIGVKQHLSMIELCHFHIEMAKIDNKIDS